MNTRSFCVVMLTLVSVLAVSGAVGAAELSPAGIAVDVEPWISDLGTVVVEIQWQAGGDEAFIAIDGPEGVEAVVEGGHLIASGDRWPLGPVSAGQSRTVEVFGLEEGQEAFLAVDRRVGAETFQLVAAIGFDDDRSTVVDARPYRIFEKEAEPRGVIRERPDGGDHAAAFHPSERTIVVESLQPKTAAVVFGEDPTDVDIPISAPADCEQATHQFSTVRQININAAPAGALTTALSIHIIMSHWDASQMQIGYTENDYYFDNYPMGAVLWWDEASQVDMDEVWTRDKYNNPLPGIGYDPNGWFQIWLVDCTGGAVGTLEYWSVEATYDAGNNIDIVADNVSVSPATAAPGDDIQVVWDGHIAGTGSIAGGFTTRIYLSNDTTITTGDTVLATINEAAASDPGDTFGDGSPGRTVTLPGGLSDGAWYVGIIVDYNDAVAESNESNNTAWDGITIDSSSSVDLVAD
ncbi:MAG: hypothetical protein ABFS37_08570, partial [Acidobacteriota bacterium]